MMQFKVQDLPNRTIHMMLIKMVIQLLLKLKIWNIELFVLNAYKENLVYYQQLLASK